MSPGKLEAGPWYNTGIGHPTRFSKGARQKLAAQAVARSSRKGHTYGGSKSSCIRVTFSGLRPNRIPQSPTLRRGNGRRRINMTRMLESLETLVGPPQPIVSLTAGGSPLNHMIPQAHGESTASVRSCRGPCCTNARTLAATGPLDIYCTWKKRCVRIRALKYLHSTLLMCQLKPRSRSSENVHARLLIASL